MSFVHALNARLLLWRGLDTNASPTFTVTRNILIMATVALLNAVAIVQAVNLYHTFAINAPLNRPLAVRHGWRIVALEQRLHIGIESLVQRSLAGGLHTPLGVLPGALIQAVLVWIYLNALPAWLFAALAWTFLYKPLHFALLRDLTIISALLAVAGYWIFPTAPPRFVLSGAPYHLRDWTYGGTSVDIGVVHTVGFNPYAAFPSVHFLWALIPAICLAYACRRAWVWVAAACIPVAMFVTVVGTGNHYVLDCLGSCAVLALSCPVVYGLHRIRGWVSRGRRPRREIPAAISLCLLCAGGLAEVSVVGGVRHLIALSILLLIIMATRRSTYLWRGRRHVEPERQPVRTFDYLAGLFFVLGSSAALHDPGHAATRGERICALLWLLACLSALMGHVLYRRNAFKNDGSAGQVRGQK